MGLDCGTVDPFSSQRRQSKMMKMKFSASNSNFSRSEGAANTYYRSHKLVVPGTEIDCSFYKFNEKQAQGFYNQFRSPFQQENPHFTVLFFVNVKSWCSRILVSQFDSRWRRRRRRLRWVPRVSRRKLLKTFQLGQLSENRT